MPKALPRAATPEGVFTLGDAWSFSGLTFKIPPLGLMLTFDADVKTARHQSENRIQCETGLGPALESGMDCTCKTPLRGSVSCISEQLQHRNAPQTGQNSTPLNTGLRHPCSRCNVPNWLACPIGMC